MKFASMVMNNYFQLLAVFFGLFFCHSRAQLAAESFDQVSSIPLDEHGNVRDNWFLYPAGACASSVEDEWQSVEKGNRKAARVSGDLEHKLFDNEKSRLAISSSTLGCPVICLNKGVPSGFITTPVEYHVYSGKRDSIKFKAYSSEVEDYMESDMGAEFPLRQWIIEACQRVEIGWTSYNANPINMFWVAPDGRRLSVGTLESGEKRTVWQVTTLGHVFDLEDAVTGEALPQFVVEYEGFHVVGDSGSRIGQNVTNPEPDIKVTLDAEWDRAHRVKRTYTEFGFNVGRVPDDLWSSLISYYNNNREEYHREEWDRKGVHVNWWEADAFMIGMPWRLKRYWQSRFKRMVEIWTGAELENTDIYGMRRYEHGARLLTHVDREHTHATSMIINIAQGDIREPWAIEIYDFAGRLHEIIMEPGDIVYYESARCLHGRMMPLNGSHYVNLFTHYRPTGDPQWFTKPNPSGSVKQVIDVGTCSISDAGAPICSKRQDISTLSPKLETLQGPLDLFKYWQKTGLKMDPAVIERAKKPAIFHHSEL